MKRVWSCFKNIIEIWRNAPITLYAFDELPLVVYFRSVNKPSNKILRADLIRSLIFSAKILKAVKILLYDFKARLTSADLLWGRPQKQFSSIKSGIKAFICHEIVDCHQ